MDFRPLFRDEVSEQSIDYQLSMADLDFYGHHPITQPVLFRGQAVHTAGAIRLTVQASLVYSAACDRCAQETSRCMEFSFEHILVNELENDQEEDFILLQDMQLDLDELLRSDVILALPMKFLCRDDCKGICSICGVNRNQAECHCSTQTVDPRLEALKQLL